jgi:hypothetical protein
MRFVPILLCIALAACATVQPTVIDDLRSAGVGIDALWSSGQPAMGDRATTGVVQGELVLIFEYHDVAKATADYDSLVTRGMLADGTPVHFAEPVRYFHKGRMVVVYVGDTPGVHALLERTMKQE